MKKTPFILLTLAALSSAGVLSARPAGPVPPAVPAPVQPLANDTLHRRTSPFRAFSQALAGVGSILNGPRNGLDGGTGRVLVSGRLMAHGIRADERVLVFDADGRCLARTPVAFTGHFRVALPAHAQVTLHFRKPGHVEKVVRVDTRNAVDSAKARRLNRNVHFDVVLVPVVELPDMAYDGPVGSISFVRGSGLMTVRHHERLMPVTADR